MSGWHRETWFETPQQGRVTRVVFSSAGHEQQSLFHRLAGDLPCNCQHCRQRRNDEAEKIYERMRARGIVV